METMISQVVNIGLAEGNSRKNKITTGKVRGEKPSMKMRGNCVTPRFGGEQLEKMGIF